ncbi:hypothetical protein VP01_1221g4 [Puccinia sorghi]|uniref:Uncharacterized protein n=1 Tax=Puccinia sorghi TaxID=27349 RepID=A0A0L6VRJ1_9BASI|nr:hypothetical protein VP01_1221g4 [Puccinia sorghi]
MEAKLVAYSLQNNADGAPEPLALINLTQAHVASLPIEIKKQQLPAGFAQGNNHAQRSVWGWFAVSSSMTESLFLLKNVVDTSLGRACLHALRYCTIKYATFALSLFAIYQAFLSTAGLRVVPVNWSLIPMRVKI